MFRNDGFQGWSNAGFYLKRNAELQNCKNERLYDWSNWSPQLDLESFLEVNQRGRKSY
jgi:hypothetical protein